ncbi:MAG: metallophosphoesterase family protein [Gemmatimonadota bacterium]
MTVTRVGLISDTHGLLRPEVFRAFDGVDLILHAGDVGDASILTDLAALAPVSAVWGNVDGWEVRDATRQSLRLEIGGLDVAVTHGHLVADLDRLPDRFPGARVIVYGHTHLPRSELRGRVRIVNPGSAGPRHAGAPVTVATLEIADGRARVRHLDLQTGLDYA